MRRDIYAETKNFRFKENCRDAFLQALRDVDPALGSWGAWSTNENGKLVKIKSSLCGLSQRVLDHAITIADGMRAWGWWEPAPGLFSYEGPIRDQQIFIDTIAPYIEADSWIHVQEGLDCIWRWYFDGNECKTQQGTVVWNQSNT